MARRYLIIIIGLVLCSSPAQSQIPYKPNAIPFPLIEGGPAVSAGYYYGGHEGSDGVIAVALNKRFRLLASYYKNDRDYIENTAIFNDPKYYQVNSWDGELGVGYCFGSNTLKKSIIECFCGWGKGRLYQKEYFPTVADAPTEKFGDFRKIFLQVNYGSEWTGVHIGFGCRLMHLKFQEYNNINYYNLGTTYSSADTTLYKEPSFVNLESAVHVGLGKRWLQAFVQIGMSSCIKSYDYSYSDGYVYIRESYNIGGVILRAGVMGTLNLSFMHNE